MSTRNELIAQIKSLAEQGRQVSERAEEHGWTVEDRQTVARLLEDVKPLKAQLDDMAENGSLKDQLKALDEDLGFRKNGELVEQASGAPDEYQSLGKGSLGEHFVKSGQYQSFVKQWPSGRIPERARVNMEPVGVKQLISITGTGGHGNLVQSQFDGLVDLLGRLPAPAVTATLSSRSSTGWWICSAGWTCESAT